MEDKLLLVLETVQNQHGNDLRIDCLFNVYMLWTAVVILLYDYGIPERKSHQQTKRQLLHTGHIGTTNMITEKQNIERHAEVKKE